MIKYKKLQIQDNGGKITLDNTPTIITERLILRKATLDDAIAMLEILSDKEVNTFLPWFPLSSHKEAITFLESKFLKYYSFASAFKYVVCSKSDNIPIGYVCISDDESNDFGYGLRKDCWRKGIMTEAALAVIQVLKRRGYTYITATHDINNPRSGEVMKKIGMKYKYTYQELVQPKNQLVLFRMYQLNFDLDALRTYNYYWDKYPIHYKESDI